MTKNHQKITEFLKAQIEPQGVQTIQKGAGISHWNTALSCCLELMTQGKILGMRTGKGWIFWIPKENQPTITGGGINVPD